MTFLPIYVYFIAISFLASLFVYRNPDLYNKSLKPFPIFLLLTLIAESYGSYLWSINKSNLYIYNFFTVFEFCFYLYFVSRIITSRKIKNLALLICILYAICAISNILFIQGVKTFHTITYSLGCLLVVSFCVYYFFELFKLPQSIKLSKSPIFWICSGLLFFYCCGFPLYAFVNFWGQVKWVIKSFDDIITILNIFLYSLFTIAFLCSRTRKYTLSSS
jgi:hypothetical protein